MKNILVPTDFSDSAGNAVDVAISIADKAGAKVHFLHCIEPLSSSSGVVQTGGSGDDMEDVFMVKLMERMESQMDDLEDKYKDTDTDHSIVVDDIYDGIMDKAKEINADLIIMGSEGASGVDEILIGSNAERVVRKSTVPTLIIKHKHEDFKIDNIVFATNAEENTADMVYTLKSFQEMFGAKLHLLNVNTPLNFYTSRSIKKMMEEYVEQHSIENYTINIYNERTEEDGIIYFADEVDANMIAMGTHGRTGLAHFFSGSIAEDVVNHSYRPVLTIRLGK